jgi:DNA (cytosine-5)-methyltransferase 1
MTAVDLFAGCGGISAGLRAAGFNILAGIDSEQISLSTFGRNFGKDRAHSYDLSEIEPEILRRLLKLRKRELTILAGGPPCQGFSKNVPRKHRYLTDPRNKLVSRFLDFVEELEPQAVLLENVAEMKNGFDQTYSLEILERLHDLKYSVAHGVLRAEDFGVPQRRRRAFFVGVRTRGSVALPQATHAGVPSLLAPQAFVSVWDAIGDLPSLTAGGGQEPCDYGSPAGTPFQRKMRANSRRLYNHVSRSLRPEQLRRLASLEPGEAMRDLPDELRPQSGYSGAYGRLTKDMLAPTMTRWLFHPGSGRFGHPVDVRTITIREAARLQAFDDRFRFQGSFIQQSHQIGNAVPPLLAEAVARALIDQIRA